MNSDYKNQATIETIIRFTEAGQLEAITCLVCECVANTIVQYATPPNRYECICRRCEQAWDVELEGVI